MKISIPIEITDPMLDNATLQILKSKIRSLVASEIDGKVNEMIEDVVDKKIKDVCEQIQKNYNYYGCKETKEQLKKMILDKASSAYVDGELIKRSIEDILNPIREFARSQILDTDKQLQYIHDRIAHEVRARLDDLFNKVSVVQGLIDGSAANTENKEE